MAAVLTGAQRFEHNVHKHEAGIVFDPANGKMVPDSLWSRKSNNGLPSGRHVIPAQVRNDPHLRVETAAAMLVSQPRALATRSIGELVRRMERPSPAQDRRSLRGEGSVGCCFFFYRFRSSARSLGFAAEPTMRRKPCSDKESSFFTLKDCGKKTVFTAWSYIATSPSLQVLYPPPHT